MDAQEQAAAYAAANFVAPNELFVDLYCEYFRDFSTGCILDLGCGPADIPVRLAQRLPGVELIAVDGAAEMIRLARVVVAQAGLESRIRLQQARVDGALALRADALVSNSLLHHLADPNDLWQCVRACGNPGAPVLVMDLVRPPSAAAAQALVDTYAAGEPEVLQRDFYSSLRAAYRPRELKEQLLQAGLAGLVVETVSDRHMVAWGRLPAAD
jgi:trans-aconitate methyltransferase